MKVKLENILINIRKLLHIYRRSMKILMIIVHH
nr:MAG TPA: hypothetical protein [Bacteriophage sp.]